MQNCNLTDTDRNCVTFIFRLPILTLIIAAVLYVELNDASERLILFCKVHWRNYFFNFKHGHSGDGIWNELVQQLQNQI